MYLLVVLACLKTDPAVCTAHELGVIPGRSAAACRIDSRQRVRAWTVSGAEPEQVLRSWSCVPLPPQAG